MKKKRIIPEFEITELFLVKAGNDYSRTFIGEIYRETTKEGKSIVHGSVMVRNSKIWSLADSQEELGKYLDDLCSMILDMGLHSTIQRNVITFNERLYLN
jgi:hypothetical protein